MYARFELVTEKIQCKTNQIMILYHAATLGSLHYLGRAIARTWMHLTVGYIIVKVE